MFLCLYLFKTEKRIFIYSSRDDKGVYLKTVRDMSIEHRYPVQFLQFADGACSPSSSTWLVKRTFTFLVLTVQTYEKFSVWSHTPLADVDLPERIGICASAAAFRTS